MKWSKRIGEFIKYVIGALLCGATAYICVEPFLKHQATSEVHHYSISEWVLAFLVIPGIFLLAFMCLVGLVFCLILAFRSLKGGNESG